MNVFRGLLCRLVQLEVDDPLVKTHLAEFVARAVASQVIELKEAYELVGGYYPMFLLCLQQLKEIQSRTWLTQALEDSKVNLMQTLPEADRNKEQLSEILDKRGLSFLQPLLRIESELHKLMGTQDMNPTAFYKWIKENVDVPLQTTRPFVGIFFLALVRHIIEKAKQDASEATFNDDAATNDSTSSPTKSISDFEKERLLSYKKVLIAFLDEKPHLQLVAIYSLQTLCHSYDFPKGLSTVHGLDTS